MDTIEGCEMKELWWLELLEGFAVNNNIMFSTNLF